MVTNSLPARHRGLPATWQQDMAAAITDPGVLLAELGIDPSLLDPDGLEGLRRAARDFPLRVPRALVGRMRRGDPDDPLLRQVLARGPEQDAVAGYVTDPLDEAAARRAPGLLQKYQGRALLVTTGACAVHCRYCFRREYDYGADRDGAERWEAALAAIAADPTLSELILSGGDPLSLSNARLGSLLRRAADIPALRRLRIHTRNPIVLPSRIDAGLLQILKASRLPVVLVVHANHAAEIDDSVRAALRALRDTGATLLNQSVLLAGVNDTQDALAELSAALFDAGVLPYYLHELDRVRGTAHFSVPTAQAQQLLQALAARLPGYLVPRLVREEPGRPGKTPIPPLRTVAD
jgi:EF-P beta-lysylation protein EpmB